MYDLSDLADGEMRCIDGVLVCRVAGEIRALADRCSHAEASLSEGRLRGGRVTCPRHGASFDVVTGEPDGPPATTPVAVYRVDATDETAVVIDLG